MITAHVNVMWSAPVKGDDSLNLTTPTLWAERELQGGEVGFETYRTQKKKNGDRLSKNDKKYCFSNWCQKNMTLAS